MSQDLSVYQNKSELVMWFLEFYSVKEKIKDSIF